MSDVLKLPVAPATCTVLGQKAQASSPLWTGLDLPRAEIRRWRWQPGGLLYPHLGAPWCHPSDQTGSPDDFDCIYRVYPRMEAGRKWKGRMVKHVDFEQQPDKAWALLVTVA